MEHSQLSQMVSWLDQAHQHDRVELTELRQQVEQLTGQRDEAGGRITGLEAELGVMRAQVERLSQLESYFGRFKDQVNAGLEKGGSLRPQTARETERAREGEVTSVARAISEFRKELDKYRRFEDEMASRRLDIQRLSAELSRLQQAVADAVKQRDESMRSVTFVDDQRRQDARRITDLQAQITEAAKRVDGVLPRLQYLEQLPARVMEVKATIEDVRQGQGKEHEKRQFLEAQIERQIKLWGEDIEAYRQRMDGYERRIEQYTEYHSVVKKATDDLRGFQETVARQQHEESELQRLSQNRQKTQMEEWQSQQEQRWQQLVADWDRQWADYDRSIAALGERVAGVETRVAVMEKRQQLLMQIAEEDAQMRAIAARDWQGRFETVMEEEA